jgi:hypothetical protein
MTQRVRDVLNDFHAGRITLEDAAQIFRSRSFPVPGKPTEAQLYGVADTPAPDPDGIGAIETDPFLTVEQYQYLARAAIAKS